MKRITFLKTLFAAPAALLGFRAAKGNHLSMGIVKHDTHERVKVQAMFDGDSPYDADALTKLLEISPTLDDAGRKKIIRMHVRQITGIDDQFLA